MTLIIVDTTVRDETDATPEEIAQAYAAGRAGHDSGIAFSAPALSGVYQSLIAGRPVGQSRTRELSAAYTSGWYDALEAAARPRPCQIVSCPVPAHLDLHGTPGDQAECQSCDGPLEVTPEGHWAHRTTSGAWGLIGWSDDPADAAHRAIPKAADR